MDWLKKVLGVWEEQKTEVIEVYYYGGACDGGIGHCSRTWIAAQAQRDQQGRFKQRLLVYPCRYHHYSTLGPIVGDEQAIAMYHDASEVIYDGSESKQCD